VDFFRATISDVNRHKVIITVTIVSFFVVAYIAGRYAANTGFVHLKPRASQAGEHSTVPTTYSWVSVLQMSDPLFTEKDGKVFMSGILISGADPATFSVAIDQTGTPIQYAKDKYHVYYIDAVWDEHNRLVVIKIEAIPANPEDFTPLFGAPLKPTLSDTELSSIIGPNANYNCLYYSYAKDHKSVFSQDYKIADADPITFKCLSGEKLNPMNHL
jgi:hypothetical protein